MDSDAVETIFGAALLAGSVLFVIAWSTGVLFGDPMIDDVAVSRWIAVPAHILLLIGVFGVYLAQSEAVGMWGLVGSLLAVSGLAIFVGYVIGGWTAAIPEPQLGPIGGIMWIAGLLILAVVTWQAGVLPQWSGVIWMAGVVLFVATVPATADASPRVATLIGATLIAGGLAWAGTSMIAID